MNRQNQIQKTIKKLKEQAAAGKEAVGQLEGARCALVTAHARMEEYRTGLEAAKIQLATNKRALIQAEHELAELRALELNNEGALVRLKQELETARVRGDAFQKELSQVEDTKKLRRRLQERHEENIKLAQQVRELEEALSKKPNSVVEKFNQRHGGTP